MLEPEAVIIARAKFDDLLAFMLTNIKYYRQPSPESITVVEPAVSGLMSESAWRFLNLADSDSQENHMRHVGSDLESKKYQASRDVWDAYMFFAEVTDKNVLLEHLDTFEKLQHIRAIVGFHAMNEAGYAHETTVSAFNEACKVVGFMTAAGAVSAERNAYDSLPYLGVLLRLSPLEIKTTKKWVHNKE